MRAAVLRETGKPLVLEDIDIDDVGPYEVRVKTVASGICHTDISIMDGQMFNSGPMVLGHEPGGIVVEVGSQVTSLAVGDHVIGCPIPGCSDCEFCTAGRTSLCRSSMTLWSRPADAKPRLSANGEGLGQMVSLASWAEEMLVHERSMVKVPESIPLDQACLVGCGVTTGMGAVLNQAQVPPGSKTVVLGCGGVGLAAIQGCRIAGAQQIVAVDKEAWKLDLAKELGATHTVLADDNTIAAVMGATGGGAHYVFECVGNGDLATSALSMLTSGGTVVLVGVPGPDHKIVGGISEMVVMEKKIQGSFLGSGHFRRLAPLAFDLYESGQLKLDELISHRLPLEDVNDAIAKIHGGEAARVVLTFD